MLLTCRASHQDALSLLQVLVLFLCMTIFGCFVYELAAVKPVWLDVAKGFIPTPEILTNTEMLYTAIGIVGEHPPPPSGPCFRVSKAADAEQASLCFSWYNSSDLDSEWVSSVRYLRYAHLIHLCNHAIPEEYVERIRSCATGATVMPHNLYLHSSIIQTRSYPRTLLGKKMAIKYGTWDSTLSLMVAFFINAAILIL